MTKMEGRERKENRQTEMRMKNQKFRIERKGKEMKKKRSRKWDRF